MVSRDDVSEGMATISYCHFFAFVFLSPAWMPCILIRLQEVLSGIERARHLNMIFLQHLYAEKVLIYVR